MSEHPKHREHHRHNTTTPTGKTPGPSTPSRRTFLTKLGTLTALGAGTLAMPALLAACQTSNGTSKNQAKDLQGVAKATKAPETPGILYKQGYKGPRASQKKPFTDGKKTFKIVVQQDTSVVGDWNKNAYSDWLEQRTGLKAQFQVVPGGPDGMTKVNAMIAAGDLPDAFLGIPFTRDQVALYGQQGLFVALDDYIETYAVELKQAIADYPDLAKVSKANDGKTYAFPAVNDCFHCCAGTSRAWINQKFLNKIGAKMPRTTEEFRVLLKAMKAQDASGHQDTVPLGGGVNHPVDRFFMNPFVYNPGEPWIALNNGKVEFVPVKPGWREGLKFLRTLYDDGSLDAQIFTRTDEALQKLGNTPGHARIGVAVNFYWGQFVDIDQEDPNARYKDYVVFPVLEGSNGKRQTAWDYYGAYTQNLVITNKCEDPGLLVQWADYQMELEAIMRSYAGVKDDNWSWATEGQLGLDGEQAIFTVKQWPSKAATSWSQYGVMYRSNDFRLGEGADPKSPTFEKPLYQETKDTLEPYAQPKELSLPPVIFDESAAATNADIATTLAQHVKQSIAQFATAKLDINDDRVWEDYVAKTEKMGLKPYLQNYQQAYDDRPKG